MSTPIKGLATDPAAPAAELGADSAVASTSGVAGSIAVLRPGSVTKVITATAVMQRVDDGLLALDDPVAQWVPAHRSPHHGGAPPRTLVGARCPATCSSTPAWTTSTPSSTRRMQSTPTSRLRPLDVHRDGRAFRVLRLRRPRRAALHALPTPRHLKVGPLRRRRWITIANAVGIPGSPTYDGADAVAC